MEKAMQTVEEEMRSIKKLGFGCMRFPLLDEEDRASFNEPMIFAMMDEFLARGFTYVDTAYMYHNYQSERMVKKALVERYPRDAYKLADKMPAMQLKTPEDQVRIFAEQLEKTGAGYFDFYLMHSLTRDKLPRLEEFGTWDFVAAQKKAGKIRHLGFSFHDDAKTLDKLLAEHPEAEFVQLQINYLDWYSKSVQSKLCYEVARRHGKPVIIMEPVKGGALATVPAEAGALFEQMHPGSSPASWALRFAAGLEGVVTVLSGMSSPEQMRDNLATMEDFKPLSEAEQQTVSRAREIILESTNIPCTECRYCTSVCPKTIAIPEYFKLYNEEKLPPEAGIKSDTTVSTDERETVGVHMGTKQNAGARAEEPETIVSSQEMYDRISVSRGKAGDCISCRRCEEQCPQHIHIPEELKKVAGLFED